MGHVRRRAKCILLLIATVTILSGSVFVATSWSKPAYPRSLQVGDNWVYRVTFPDGHAYTLTETVLDRIEVNGSATYVILADDDQHISTNYMWLTYDWHEIKSIKPHIGNLQASSVTIYTPPIELIHVPLRVGDNWEINSSSRTIVDFADNTTQTTMSLTRQTRETLRPEQINTLAGRFQAFRIEVLSSDSPFETIWFSGKLGQIVYAEFYNPLGEVVTRTLTSYTLSDASGSWTLAQSVSSLFLVGSAESLTEVISTTNLAISYEMKITYD